MRTEEELMDAYVAGDARAFEALFRHACASAWRASRRLSSPASSCC